ncbi:MAG: hypothetical protein FWD40_06305 [Treponema sp.]|nr:hypothetical protein [Treponema sp.]
MCIYLPPLWLLPGIAAAFTAGFYCGILLREQLTDLKPVFIYAILMYFLSVFSLLTENYSNLSLQIFIPRIDFIQIAFRLFFIVQLSALLFRTTSSVELKYSLNNIEVFIRKNLKIPGHPSFSNTISLFICFIPEIFSIWQAFNLSWKARAGREGLLKIKTLLFVLISLSFEKAAKKAIAIEARENF